MLATSASTDRVPAHGFDRKQIGHKFAEPSAATTGIAATKLLALESLPPEGSCRVPEPSAGTVVKYAKVGADDVQGKSAYHSLQAHHF